MLDKAVLVGVDLEHLSLLLYRLGPLTKESDQPETYDYFVADIVAYDTGLNGVFSFQVVLPLGDVPDKRSGKDPVGDSAAYPIKGPVIECLTGEKVVVRKAPDMDAVEAELKVSIGIPQGCDAMNS